MRQEKGRPQAAAPYSRHARLCSLRASKTESAFRLPCAHRPHRSKRTAGQQACRRTGLRACKFAPPARARGLQQRVQQRARHHDAARPGHHLRADGRALRRLCSRVGAGFARSTACAKVLLAAVLTRFACLLMSLLPKNSINPLHTTMYTSWRCMQTWRQPSTATMQRTSGAMHIMPWLTPCSTA